MRKFCFEVKIIFLQFLWFTFPRCSYVVTKLLNYSYRITLYRILFWTDWGSSARIESANMDGTNRKVVVGSDLVWPNGVTVDIAGSRIYWTDAGKDRIEVANFDGSNRQVGGDLLFYSCRWGSCFNVQAFEYLWIFLKKIMAC